MPDSLQPVGSFTVTPEELCPQYDESSSFTRSLSGLFWVRPTGICHPDPQFVLWIQAAQRFLMAPLLGKAPGVAAKVQQTSCKASPQQTLFRRQDETHSTSTCRFAKRAKAPCRDVPVSSPTERSKAARRPSSSLSSFIAPRRNSSRLRNCSP